MDGFHVTFQNLDKLVARYKGADKVVRVELKGWGERSGRRVERSAKDAAPVKTGTYRRSITSVTTASSLNVVSKIGPGDLGIYPRVIEFGSRPHTITPRNARVLAFKVGGKQVFARSVQHPGTKALHIMRNALATNRAAITRDGQDMLRRIVRKLGG